MPGRNAVLAAADLGEHERLVIPGRGVWTRKSDRAEPAHGVIVVAGLEGILVGDRGNPARVVDDGRHARAVCELNQLRNAALPVRECGRVVPAVHDGLEHPVGLIGQRLLELAERVHLPRQRGGVVLHARGLDAVDGSFLHLAHCKQGQVVVKLADLGVAVAERAGSGDAQGACEVVEAIGRLR